MYGTDVAAGGTGATLAATGLSMGAGALTVIGLCLVGVALVTAARMFAHRGKPRP